MGQFGQFGLGLGFNPISGVDVEAAMDPRAQERARSGGRRLGLSRNRMTLARKSYLSGLMGQLGRGRLEGEESIGDQGMEVRMGIEVFAEGVNLNLHLIFFENCGFTH
jgi:hypothetical protein